MQNFICVRVTPEVQELRDSINKVLGGKSALSETRIANIIGAWQLDTQTWDMPTVQQLAEYITELQKLTSANPLTSDNILPVLQHKQVQRRTEKTKDLVAYDEKTRSLVVYDLDFDGGKYDYAAYRDRLIQKFPDYEDKLTEVITSTDSAELFAGLMALYKVQYPDMKDLEREAFLHALNIRNKAQAFKRNSDSRKLAAAANSVIERVNTYRAWTARHIRFDAEEHKYYFDGVEVPKSVTQYFNDSEIPEQWKVAGWLGTEYDSIFRDYFKGLFQSRTAEVLAKDSKYPNTNVQIWRHLKRNVLPKLNTLLTKKFGRFQVITSEFPLVGYVDGQRIAGTMDLLLVDENGGIHILDFKVKRHPWEADSKYAEQDRERYTQQLNAYKILFQQNFPDLADRVVDTHLIWFDVDYPAPGDGVSYARQNNGVIAVNKPNPAFGINGNVIDLAKLAGHKDPATGKPLYSLPSLSDEVNPLKKIKEQNPFEQHEVTGSNWEFEESAETSTDESTDYKNTDILTIHAGRGENSELSNMAVRPFTFTLPGEDAPRQFQTVEHAFQAAKIALFLDACGTGLPEATVSSLQRLIEEIVQANSGFTARKLGGDKDLFTKKHKVSQAIVDNFFKEVWSAQKYALMWNLVQTSFDSNPEAKQHLLDTGSALFRHDEYPMFAQILYGVKTQYRAAQTIAEHVSQATSSDFRLTTEENVEAADATIVMHIADDSEEEAKITSTKEQADLRQKPLIEVALNVNGNDNALQIAEQIYLGLQNAGKTQDVSINFTGNTISAITKKGTRSQQYYNNLLRDVLRILQEKGVTFSELRNSGISGIEESVIKAAQTLEINWQIHTTQDWADVKEDGARVRDRYQFLSKFGLVDTSVKQYSSFVPRMASASRATFTRKTTVTFPLTGKKLTIPKGTTIAGATSLPEFSSAIPKRFNKAHKFNMTFSFYADGEWQHRSTVRAKNTFDAIVNGERTATTRYSDDGKEGTWDKWKGVKVGDIIEFRGPKENGKSRILYVRVTKITPLTATMASEDGFAEEWSRKEGWGIRHFQTATLPHLQTLEKTGGEAMQVEYEFLYEEDNFGSKREFKFNQFIFPVWQAWAEQNPEIVDSLREKLAGKSILEGNDPESAMAVARLLGLQINRGNVNEGEAVQNVLELGDIVNTFVQNLIPTDAGQETTSASEVPEITTSNFSTDNVSTTSKFNSLWDPAKGVARCEDMAHLFSDAVTKAWQREQSQLQNTIKDLLQEENPDMEQVQTLEDRLHRLQRSDGRSWFLKNTPLSNIIADVKQIWENDVHRWKSLLPKYANNQKTTERLNYLIAENQLVCDNFGLLLEQALPYIEALENCRLEIVKSGLSEDSYEGMATTSESDSAYEEAEYEDDEGGERSVNGNEGWGTYKIREVDQEQNQSGQTRLLLSHLPDVDYKGKIRQNDLGRTKYLDPHVAYNKIRQICASMIDPDDFVIIKRDSKGSPILDDNGEIQIMSLPTLEKAVRRFPWIKGVISWLYDNPDKISAFYSDFRTDFILMMSVYEREINNGNQVNYILTPYAMNRPLEVDSVMTVVTRNYDAGVTVVSDSIFSASQSIVRENVLAAQSYLADFKKFYKECTEDYLEQSEDELLRNEVVDDTAKELEHVLRMLGFDIDARALKGLLVNELIAEREFNDNIQQRLDAGEEIDTEDQVYLGDIDTIVNNVSTILTNAANSKLDFQVNHFIDFNRVAYRKIAAKIGQVSELDISASFNDAGKNRQSYSPPNYAATVFKRLTSSRDGAQQYIKTHYARSNWFYQGIDRDSKSKIRKVSGYDGTGRFQSRLLRSLWLQIFYTDKVDGKSVGSEIRDRVKLGEVLKLEGNYYNEWTPSLIERGYITMYYSQPDTSSGVPMGYYGFPTLSDAAVGMGIPMIRFTDSVNDVPGTYKDKLMVHLEQVLRQELTRISIVEAREQAGVEPIQNYDSRGKKFCFFPALNTRKVQLGGEEMLFLDAVKKLSVEDRTTELNNLITNTLREVIDDQCASFVQEVRDSDNDLETTLSIAGVVNSNRTFEEALEEYYWNNAFAQTQIIELTVTDLAFFADDIDFQKRFKSVYSAGKKLNTNSKYGRKTMRYVILSDDNRPSRTWDQLSRTLRQAQANGNITEDEATTIEYKMLKIKSTDGQAYRTPESYRAVLDMLGQWDEKQQEALQRLSNGKWTMQDFNVVWQVIKPFVSGQVAIPDEISKSNVILGPVQLKDSEFLLLALADIMGSGVNQSPQLRGLQAWMRARDVDVAVFGSGVKTLGHKPVDITYSTNALTEALDSNLLSGNRHSTARARFTEVVKNIYKSQKLTDEEINEKINSLSEFDLAKTALQWLLTNHKISSDQYNGFMDFIIPDEQGTYDILEEALQESLKPTTREVDGKMQEFPSQSVIHEVPYDYYFQQQPNPEHLKDAESVVGSQFRNMIISDLPESFECVIRGKHFNRSQIIDLYMRLTVENLFQDFDEAVAHFGSIEALSEKLKAMVKGNSAYDRDFLNAFEIVEITDPTGKKKKVFNIPLDTSFTSKIQQLICSIFKNAVAKQKMNGAACTLVSDFGLSRTLKVEYYQDGNKNSGIKCIQCRLPLATKKLLYNYLNADGTLDISDLPEEILQGIGFRIPTENKYSMAPLKVVGFLPEQNGSVIMLPADFVQQSGTDFDIDKLFMLLPKIQIRKTYGIFKHEKEQKRSALMQFLRNSMPESSNAEINEFITWLSSEYKTWEQDTTDEMATISDKEDFIHNVSDDVKFGRFLQYMIEQGWHPDYKAFMECLIHENKGFTKWFKRRKHRYLIATKTRPVEYHLDVDPSLQNRAARDNMLIEISTAILTHPSTAFKVNHPGGYDTITTMSVVAQVINDPQIFKAFRDWCREKFHITSHSAVRKKLNELIEAKQYRVLESIVKDFAPIRDPLSLQTFIHFHQQNMLAKKLVAIFANVDSMQAKYQHTKLGIKKAVKFNGKTYNSLHDVTNPNGELISFNCAELLAAAVDNAKDPRLATLGINPKTAEFIGTMLRMGIPIKDAALLISNRWVQQGLQNSGLMNDYVKICLEALRALGVRVKKDIAFSTDFTTDMLMDTNITLAADGGASIIDDNVAKNGDREYILNLYKMLQLAKYIKEVTDEVSELTRISRADSPSGGTPPSIEELMVNERRAELFHQKAQSGKSLLTGIDTIFKPNIVSLNMSSQKRRDTIRKSNMPMLQAFYDYGISLPLHAVSPYFSQCSGTVRELVAFVFENAPRGIVDASVLKQLFKDLQTFALSKLPRFSGEKGDEFNKKRDYYLYDFPHEFLELKRSISKIDTEDLTEEEQQNISIASLDIIRKMTVNKNGKIVMYRSGRMTETERQKMRQQLDTIMAIRPELAVKLFEYSYYVEQLGYGPNNFGWLFSADFKARFTDVIEAQRNLVSELQKHKSMFYNFLQQFYVNRVQPTVGRTASATGVVRTIVLPSNQITVITGSENEIKIANDQVLNVRTGNPLQVIQVKVKTDSKGTVSTTDGLYVLVGGDATHAQYKKMPTISDMLDEFGVKYNANLMVADIAKYAPDKERVDKLKHIHSKKKDTSSSSPEDSSDFEELNTQNSEDDTVGTKDRREVSVDDFTEEDLEETEDIGALLGGSDNDETDSEYTEEDKESGGKNSDFRNPCKK